MRRNRGNIHSRRIAVCALLTGCVWNRMTWIASAEEQKTESLWLTPRLTQVLVDRILNDVTERYKLDERQKVLFQEQVTKRVPAFLDKHRPVLEPVLNELVEQYISGRTPTTQQVAGWASKILPPAREAVEEVEAAVRVMRPYLRPEQTAHWGRDHFQFRLGCTLAEAKLRAYSEGRFDASEWTMPLPGPHQGEQEIFQQARRAGLSTTPPRSLISSWSSMGRSTTASALQRLGSQGGRSGSESYGAATESVEPDQWEAYLKKFISVHRCDEGQKTSGLAILKDVQGRAQAHRQEHAPEYARLARAVLGASGDEVSRCQDELMALDAPVVNLFEEFRGRLDQLLTESQRRQADTGR